MNQPSLQATMGQASKWRRIRPRFDWWLWLCIAAFCLITLTYTFSSMKAYLTFLPMIDKLALEVEQLSTFTEIYMDLILLVLVMISILTVQQQGDPRERGFWRLTAFAYSTWLVLRLIFLMDTTSVLHNVVGDSFYFVFYCLILLALEARVRPSGLSSFNNARYWLNGLANLMFVSGIFVYFVIIPAVYAPEVYETWLPSFLCYLSLDLYIFVRYLLVTLNVRSPRWQMIFGLCTATALLWGIADLHEAVNYASGQFFLTGKLADLIWVLPYTLPILATRIRSVGPDTGLQLMGSSFPKRVSPVSDRLLIINAFILPLVHLLGYATGVLDHASKLERGAFIFFWMLAMSILLLVQYSMLNRRNRLLENLRLRNVRILEAISRVQGQFIAATDSPNVFENMLEQLLGITDSEYGFVGEIHRTEDDKPYLKTLAIAYFNVSGDSRRFYGSRGGRGEEIHDLDTLFGAAVTTGSPVIANDPAAYPRRGGFPHGTPEPHAYLGIPLYHREQLIGMFGIANRSKGYDADLLKYLEPFSTTCAGIISAYHNERERKRMSELASRFGRILDDSLQEIYIFDALTLRFLQVNRGARENIGYTDEELRGLSPEDLYPEMGNRFRDLIKPLQEGIQEKIQFTTSHLRKDGTTYPVDVYMQLAIFEGKQVFVAIVLDITERKRMEKEKSRLESQIIQSQKLETIGTLAGGIAHDFNNILAPIIWYTEMIVADEDNDEEIREDLKHVLKAANRAKDLVQQILTFGRMKEVERSPVQIQLVIEEAIKLLRASLPSTIDIDRAVDNKCEPVLADPTQIHQVVMNLCTNAYHAMRDGGGVLHISLEMVELDDDQVEAHPNLMPGRWVRLCVSDTGHGMDPTTLDRIFEPFFTTKRVGEGTGLGLSVIHGIVMTYGGAITVDSKPEKGTAFFVYLPPVDYDEILEKKNDNTLDNGVEHILFVDDEEEIVRTGQLMLQRFGYTVTATTDPKEALHIFQEAPDEFDLIITDQTMPGLTGLRLAAELKAVRQDIPIVLSTGFSEDAADDKWKEVGIDRFVMKPVVGRELHRIIRSVLDDGHR